ncbi:hypothetical protein ACUNWD_20605 [Sunxiuqinia sp. A32]|uniref:hypothetical protein n=1 Tax=Sunxiuqinia sp. A32 TaxID=3461496 RepID=UPI004045EB64
MNDINEDFKYLRINFRKNGKIIAEDVFKRVHPAYPKNTKEICVFCKSTSGLTREHVFPQWVFENNTDISMISSVNNQTQTYHKAVVPTCSTCNNVALSNIEECIIKTLKIIDSEGNCTKDDLSNIIRWLEILDYKLQVNDCRRKYIKYGNSKYSREFGKFPVAMLRHFFEMSPFKAYNFLRQSQNRITIKRKLERIDSLLIFKPKISEFNFFNLPNEHIFLNFPMFKIAIFYFFRKSHNNEKEALNEAYEIMTKVLNE